MPQVTGIRIHPRKDEPSVDLEQCLVEPEGLHGDRRKKAAVHLVAAQESEGVRANLVVDLDPASLAASVGHLMTVGEAVLEVGRTSGSCPGVYADVRTPGTVRLGDGVEVSTAR